MTLFGPGDPPPPPEPTLWYFGYGSNMERGTFLGRRQMKPVEVCPAVLADWALCFDLGIGPGERGVGNVRRAPGTLTWGVAWRITRRQAQHLDRTEGVHKGGYRRLPVTVLAGDGRPLEAFTYRSEHGRAGRKPSRRYMGLLLRGAREHGLPETWVEHLRGFELAVDERTGQGSLFEPGRRSS